MPLKTKYEIYGRFTAPILSTFDKTMARVEWYSYVRNPQQGIHRLVQDVIPEGELTKAEEYLLLVYRVRRLWRRFYDCGRKEEDKAEAIALQDELDSWNFRNKCYITNHPDYKPADQESFDFYVVVQAWRDTCKERGRYRGGSAVDKMVLHEIRSKIRDFERKIDQYLKKKLNLI